MNAGRIPAQDVGCRPDVNILSSHNSFEGVQSISQNMGCQPVPDANIFHHEPNEPKLFQIPSNHKPRAKIVQETLKKLTRAYEKPKAYLKSLQFHNETDHQVRSERREAAIALLQVMTYYQDDATGRIGRQMGDGSFRDLSLAKLAKYAGIGYRRAKRALKDIIKAGYLRVTRQFVRHLETGLIRGLASIRVFTQKLFTDLDVKGEIWMKWFTQRGWAKEREDKKVNKQQKKRARAMIGLVKETLGSVGKKAAGKILGIVNGIQKEPSEKERLRSIEHKQMLCRKALELFNLDPSKSVGDYHKELHERYPFK